MNTLDEIRNSLRGMTPFTSDEQKADVIQCEIKSQKRIIVNQEKGRCLHERFGHVTPKQVSLIFQKKFNFNNMTAYIREHCRRCDVCKRNKTRLPR